MTVGGCCWWANLLTCPITLFDPPVGQTEPTFPRCRLLSVKFAPFQQRASPDSWEQRRVTGDPRSASSLHSDNSSSGSSAQARLGFDPERCPGASAASASADAFTRSVGDIRPRECHKLRLPRAPFPCGPSCDLPTPIRNQSLVSKGVQGFRHAGPTDPKHERQELVGER